MKVSKAITKNKKKIIPQQAFIDVLTTNNFTLKEDDVYVKEINARTNVTMVINGIKTQQTERIHIYIKLLGPGKCDNDNIYGFSIGQNKKYIYNDIIYVNNIKEFKNIFTNLY